MVFSRTKRGIRIGAVKIEQVQRFKFLANVLTEDGKSDTEIKKRICITKDVFQKLIKVLETKK